MSLERQLSAESSSSRDTSSNVTGSRNHQLSAKQQPSGASDITEVYPQDSILPKTVILRFIREAAKFCPRPAPHSRSEDRLPKAAAAADERFDLLHFQSNISVSDDALFAIQKHAHDFVSFITHEANEICSKDKRKTITGDDIIAAFDSMGFDNYSRILQVYYIKWKHHRLLRGPSISINEMEPEDG
jgi:histone H3/H4